MHLDPFEWKSIQASLVNHPHHNQSLSNTTREQYSNAQSPKMSDLREGMSSRYSLQMRILFNSNEASTKLLEPMLIDSNLFNPLNFTFLISPKQPSPILNLFSFLNDPKFKTHGFPHLPDGITSSVIPVDTVEPTQLFNTRIVYSL